MKYLTILLLLCFACSKEELGTVYTVQQGGNIFYPQWPEVPFQSNTLTYKFMIGQEWWEGEMTEPSGFGCKLFALGNYNYHTGGANSALSYSEGRVYWSPRYYESITSGTYLLHELPGVEIQPDTWYTVKMTMEPLRWYLDGKLINMRWVNLPHGWLAQPFLGRSGNDRNYPGGDIPGALATRELHIHIIK